MSYRKKFKKTKLMFFLTALSLTSASAQVLKSVETINLQDGAYQLRYHFDRAVKAPTSFYNKEKHILVMDVAASGVSGAVRDKKLDNDLLQNIRNIYSGNRLRSTVYAKHDITYDVTSKDNVVYVQVNPNNSSVGGPTWDNLVPENNQVVSNATSARDIGFMRSSRGEGIVEVFLPNDRTEVNVVEEGRRIRLALKGHVWDPSQNRRIEVTDFATPVSSIDVVNIKGTAYVDIKTQSAFEYSTQQLGNNKYQLVVKPKRASTAHAPAGSSEKNYTGEPITINFQDIDVRAVLQIIADFTGLNIVVSDRVDSRITIRLQNVPWDQALDTVLMYTGLGQAKEGNVIFVAPMNELNAIIKENLVTELIQINFADADALAKVIATRVSGGQGGDTIGAGLSERGSVNVDTRTNMLIVQDTAPQLKIVKDLIRVLDRPVRQVQISAQIVAAFDDYSRDLGVNWGAKYQKGNGRGIGQGNIDNENKGGGGFVDSDDKGINAVSLGVSQPAFSFGYMVLGSELNIGLELSAMQEQSKGEIMSNPIVLTTDRQEAYIKQGSEISYSTSSDGGTNTEFKEVVMELRVTPQITPNGKILMDLLIKKDEVGVQVGNTEPPISKKELKTQALVSDGETIVLGGIYEHNVGKIDQKVPFFGDLPMLGNLFKKQNNVNKKVELLIFVTPNIIDTLGY